MYTNIQKNLCVVLFQTGLSKKHSNNSQYNVWVIIQVSHLVCCFDLTYIHLRTVYTHTQMFWRHFFIVCSSRICCHRSSRFISCISISMFCKNAVRRGAESSTIHSVLASFTQVVICTDSCSALKYVQSQSQKYHGNSYVEKQD